MPEEDAPAHTGGADTGDDAETPHPLLEIQRLDTETEQLQHRMGTLPQRRDLRAVQAERSELQQNLDTVNTQRLEVLQRQKRLEQEAATIEAKADTDDRRLYSGEVRAIRDLQALQDEVAGLRSRQGHLEEQAIEALMEVEELENRAASLQADLDRNEERATVLEAEVASAEASIEVQLVSVLEARSRGSAGLEASTLASYERLRQSFGPSTAVEFDPTSGCGCPQQMPAMEVSRIKRCPEGSVESCSECDRLVIR